MRLMLVSISGEAGLHGSSAHLRLDLGDKGGQGVVAVCDLQEALFVLSEHNYLDGKGLMDGTDIHWVHCWQVCAV